MKTRMSSGSISRTVEVAEYGVSHATISNWVRSYREEYQTNDNEKSQLELMEELYKLRQENEELEKENRFLKKIGILCQGNRLVPYQFIDENKDDFCLRWLLKRMNIHRNAYYNYSKQKKFEYNTVKASTCAASTRIFHEVRGIIGHFSSKRRHFSQQNHCS